MPIVPLVAGAAALVLIVTGSVLWFGGFFAPFFAAASSDGKCETTEPIAVVADPSVTPSLADIAKNFDKVDTHCSDVTVRSQDSADTAAVLATGGKLDADIWVPDSRAWVDRVNAISASIGRPAPKLQVGEAVATTPIVFAADASRIEDLSEAPVGWGSILAGQIDAVLADPEGSAASLASLATLKERTGKDARVYSAAALELGKTIPASTGAALGAVFSAKDEIVAITTERAVAAYNATATEGELAAVYPNDGTIMLEYPFIRLGGDEPAPTGDAEPPAESDEGSGDTEGDTSKGDTSKDDAEGDEAKGDDASAKGDAAEEGAAEGDAAEEGDSAAKDAASANAGSKVDAHGKPKALTSKKELIDAFEDAVHAGSKRLAKAAFRDSKGSGDISATGVLEEPIEAKPAAAGAAQVELLREWSVLNLRSRMLAVIDVSGSMEEPAGNGLRRIDVFQQAAIGAMSKFSGEVELGVWVFSTLRNGGADYEDLSPLAPLGDPGHLAEVQGIIQSLPQRLGGGTGLYDTTLAAVKKVTESYDPNKVNTVLLITDGKNEDEGGGLDLNGLLAELDKIHDPKRPVAVIMIGFGPDTDMDAMTKIAQATGGAAYSATQPEDLGLVLVDAISQRSCRPNC
ncbi:VWA domain-containing protein [Agromyces archimandritae]|uniref:VWA domain-containing protein n=1 Tax=Agromyces archimandritae TaxID=2781962 RepID=A0A975INH0_9MICO|nr:VWA domain-containing protein [Agromyces archimandritae]QTX04234.1 VWA domain-containing protein [Agromyces archimandritae]